MKLKDKIKKSPVGVACVTSQSNKKTFAKTMLLDLGFVLIIYIINKLLSMAVPNPNTVIVNAGTTVVVIILAIVAYALLMLFVYSVFKFMVMHYVHSLFEKSSIHWKDIGKFYKSNILMLSVFFVIFILLSAAFVTTIKIDVLSNVRDVFFTITAMLLYLVLNTQHSIFKQQKLGVTGIVKKSFSVVFNNFKRYVWLIVLTVAAFFVVVAFYYAINWLVLFLLGKSISNAFVYLGYVVFSSILIFVLGDMLLAFNRVYFYCLTQKNINKKR